MIYHTSYMHANLWTKSILTKYAFILKYFWIAIFKSHQQFSLVYMQAEMPDGQDSLWSLQICLILVDLMKMDILYRIFDFVTSFLLMVSLQGLLELSALSRPLLDSVLFLLLLFVCAFSESKDLLWIESFGPKLSI